MFSIYNFRGFLSWFSVANRHLQNWKELLKYPVCIAELPRVVIKFIILLNSNQ